MENNAKAVPMRGPVKDAEAEALLRLLRQEKEFHSQACMPTNIQRKMPLPAIGSKCQNEGGPSQLSDQRDMRESSLTTKHRAMSQDRQNERELQNESRYQWANRKNSTDSGSGRSPPSSNVRISPGYSWRTAGASYLGSKEKKPTHCLPPIGYDDSAGQVDSAPTGRPSCPLPSSQFWDD